MCPPKCGCALCTTIICSHAQLSIAANRAWCHNTPLRLFSISNLIIIDLLFVNFTQHKVEENRDSENRKTETQSSLKTGSAAKLVAAMNAASPPSRKMEFHAAKAVLREVDDERQEAVPVSRGTAIAGVVLEPPRFLSN